MQLPLWHVPPRQAVPSGSFFLHLPRLRFLQGGQGFCFLASVQSGRRVPSRLAQTVPSSSRREPMVVSERAQGINAIGVHRCLQNAGDERQDGTAPNSRWARTRSPAAPGLWASATRRLRQSL